MSLHSNILKQLHRAPMSLADLEATVPVSLPTLRKAVQELTDAHWIRVVGQAETSGGRPAMLFGLDPDYYLLVGVQLKLPGMRMVACDLTGQIVDESEVYQAVTARPDQAIQIVTDYVETVRTRFSQRQLLGIGLAAPGFIDPESGDIIAIGRVPDWQHVPICQQLSARVDLPVKIANDVDCMAFAEFRHTGITLDRNLAYVGYDEGAKISMFLGGNLYKGSLGNTGLVVADLLNLDPRFSPAAYRQILTLSGVNRLFKERIDRLDADTAQAYANIVAAQNPWQRFRLILDGALDGLPVCVELNQMLTTVLAAAVANIVLVIQPDTLIIGGALSAMPAPLLNRLELAIRESLPTLFTNRLIIQQAKLSSNNSAPIGAVIHWLQDYLARGDLELVRQSHAAQPSLRQI